MTPTEAREFMDGTFGPARARTVITKLADQVEALTKERDALNARLNVLEAAAKLALDVCIDMRRHGDQRSVAMAIGAEAAIRQAVLA